MAYFSTTRPRFARPRAFWQLSLVVLLATLAFIVGASVSPATLKLSRQHSQPLGPNQRIAEVDSAISIVNSDFDSLNALFARFPSPGPVTEASSTTTTSPISETSSTAAQPEAVAPVEQSAPEVTTQQPVVASSQAAAPPAPAVAAPAAAPPAPAVAPVQTPAERWRARGVIFENVETWDDVSLGNVDAAFSALPARLLSSLGNAALGPIHVLVNPNGRTLSGSQPYGGAANFFSTNDGVNELVLYPRQSVFTITHELGHAYNLRHIPAGRYALVLLDPEMQTFLAATGWHVVSSEAEVRAALDQTKVNYSYNGGFTWSKLSHNDPLEDFANSFASFYLDPSSLQANSPARYDWFASHLGR